MLIFKGTFTEAMENLSTIRFSKIAKLSNDLKRDESYIFTIKQEGNFELIF